MSVSCALPIYRLSRVFQNQPGWYVLQLGGEPPGAGCGEQFEPTRMSIVTDHIYGWCLYIHEQAR
jgi:hypothetical protein